MRDRVQREAPARKSIRSRTAGVHRRGRAARVVGRVLRATAEELGRVGYAGLRVEDVAARAGVNKTTVYRRWPTKAELVSAAVRALPGQRSLPDTGTLRGDLRASLLEVLAQAAHPIGRGFLRMALFERTAPEVDALARSLSEENRRQRVAIVERGISRGELPEGTDPQLVVELVTAPALRRAFTFEEKVDASYIDRVLDVVLAGFAARPTPSPRSEAPSARRPAPPITTRERHAPREADEREKP